MRRFIIKASILISSLLVPAAARAGAAAEALQRAGTGAGYNPEQNDPVALAGSIVGYFLGLLGTVFVVLMIYAGYLYMTAQGNEEQVEKAKGLIKNAVIGLVIVFTS